eukprot:CAMPEP_0204365968 /NCGR_PEP_ID=MMETSP0469-20131031/42310_1 /ASSEMBLY_ACC=CAM_ASM_000384 /TAXON_ID=2969 /ORGANISM="Oxyrrhis marina" /LENGTH=39 /DNA_ID= /DNA_START= /DNA_END= /DNA_ORIENTATION=
MDRPYRAPLKEVAAITHEATTTTFEGVAFSIAVLFPARV